MSKPAFELLGLWQVTQVPVPDWFNVAKAGAGSVQSAFVTSFKGVDEPVRRARFFKESSLFELFSFWQLSKNEKTKRIKITKEKRF